MPFAVVGVTLYYLDIVSKLKKYKTLSIFFIVVIIFLILEFNIFVKIRGFSYPGIFLNVGGICTFILFSLLSIHNRKLLFLLKIITKFTGGIYYIHMIFYFFLIQKVYFVHRKTFQGSIVI